MRHARGLTCSGCSIFWRNATSLPQRARDAIANAFEFLQTFPFACRKAAPEHSFLREMVIGFGQAGYVALYEIEDGATVTVLAVRHQREEDLY